MKIRPATDLDKNNWNQYVSAHPEATPYHRYEWKQCVEQAYGHTGYYLIAENEQQKIIGVLPTIKIKAPLISGELCALPFCDVGGVLGDDETITQALITQALTQASELKLSRFEHRASALNKDESSLKVRMLLALPESSEMLLKGFKAKHRSQINKAKKNGLTFKIGRDASLIDDFYQVFAINMHKLGSPVHSKAWFKAIQKHYADQMIVSTVWLEDQVIGAGIVLLNGKKASIPWASTNAKYNRLAPNMLLYWSLLEYVSDHGYEQFDFGRSTVDEGTYRFKKQWGAQPQSLQWQTYHNGALQQENLSQAAQASGQLRTMIESGWRKLPIGFTVWLGPKIRKYISL